MTPEERENNGIEAKNETSLEVVDRWQAISVENMADMYWKYGYSEYSYGGTMTMGSVYYLLGL